MSVHPTRQPRVWSTAVLIGLALQGCTPRLAVGPIPRLGDWFTGAPWLDAESVALIPAVDPASGAREKRFVVSRSAESGELALSERHHRTWSREPIINPNIERTVRAATEPPLGFAFGDRVDLFAGVSDGSRGTLAHIWRDSPESEWDIRLLAPGATFDVALDIDRATLHLAYSDVWKISYYARFDLEARSWSSFTPLLPTKTRADRIFIEVDRRGNPYVFALIRGAVHFAVPAQQGGIWHTREIAPRDTLVTATDATGADGSPLLLGLSHEHHLLLFAPTTDAPPTTLATLTPEQWPSPALFTLPDSPLTFAIASPDHLAMLCSDNDSPEWRCGSPTAIHGAPRFALALGGQGHLLTHHDDSDALARHTLELP